jgi:AraC-like DNA-binding protein
MASRHPKTNNYLIFVSLNMGKTVGLETFYSDINQSSGFAKNDIGHFNIFRVEDILLSRPDKPKKITYSRRSFFKVSLVKGHSRIHYADRSVEISDTALVFTNPTMPFFWERISKKHTGYVCIFTEAFLSRFENIRDYPVFQIAGAGIIPLSSKEASAFNELFLRMFGELQSHYFFKYPLLRNLLMEVVHRAVKMQPLAPSPAMASNASERLSASFAELLERQFPIELSYQIIQLNAPAAFARQLNVHVNHLNKALKETTGMTTSQLISQRLMQEAKILLKSTNWTISEIAWSLGFEEPNHFSTFFKNSAHATPQKFRKTKID